MSIGRAGFGLEKSSGAQYASVPSDLFSELSISQLKPKSTSLTYGSRHTKSQSSLDVGC